MPVALAASLGLGTPARADETGFSTANIVGGLVRAAVSYARFLVDIRYDGLQVDARRGAVTLRGLHVTGLGQRARCRVDLGRLEVSGISFWGAEDLRSRFEAADLAISTNCFGPDAALIGMVTGGDTIPLQSLVVDMRQVSGSGAARFDIQAVSPGIARIEASADFTYVSVIMPGLLDEIAGNADPYGEMPTQDLTFDEDGLPVMPATSPEVGLRGELRAAHVTVEDLGLWARAQPLLPPDATSPEAVQSVITAPPGSPLRHVQEELAAALTSFIAQPGRITAQIRPDQPVLFDSTTWTDPAQALAGIPIAITNAPPSPPVALIARVEGAGDPLSLGLALAEGRGLPQNTRRAIELLGPLENDAEALLTLARLRAETDPRAAYATAQRAAALGDSRAPALLDRIEARMAVADLLAAQARADAPLPDEAFASLPALRAAAAAYAEGDGVPRSYELARRLAGSAAAVGDGFSQALLARLDSRFGADPAWTDARNQAEDMAMRDWTGRGLASRFAGD